MMGKAAANASYTQDHPRSANRVKLLQVRRGKPLEPLGSSGWV
jgi:hypothetical protein